MKQRRTYTREFKLKVLRECENGKGKAQHSQNIDIEDLMENEVLKRAFARSFEIIGEASKNLLDILKEENPEIEWKKIKKSMFL